MNIDDLHKKAEPFINPTPADGRTHEEQDMMAAGPAYKELTAKLVSEWPAIRDEINRLTGEVNRLEADRDEWKETALDGRREYQKEHKFWRDRNGILKAKADALAEAVDDANFEHIEMPNDDFGVYQIDGPDWENIQDKFTAYRNKEIIQGEVGKEIVG